MSFNHFMSQIRNTRGLCAFLYSNFCNCAVDEMTKPQLRQTQLQYYEQLKAIADDVKYQDSDSFAVVLQPHMRDMIPPIDVCINHLTVSRCSVVLNTQETDMNIVTRCFEIGLLCFDGSRKTWKTHANWCNNQSFKWRTNSDAAAF